MFTINKIVKSSNVEFDEVAPLPVIPVFQISDVHKPRGTVLNRKSNKSGGATRKQIKPSQIGGDYDGGIPILGTQLKRQNLGDRTPEFQSAPSIRSPQEIINSRGLRRHQFRQFETPPPPGRRAAEQAPRSELDSQDIDRTLLQDDNPFFEREDSIPRDSEEPELEEPSEISDIMTVRKEDRKKGSKNKVHEQVEEYQRHTRSKTKQEENESLPPLPDQNDDFEEFYDVQFAFRAALKAATASPDQQTVTEALNGENADEWRAAIKKEFKNHDQNGISEGS
ncbi:hypothetical protein LTS02_015631 [Friedmanniomyces endolithicus]|nr:hypothetical protein LTS02_015631 [Friedmanniomyces endolithicus]